MSERFTTYWIRTLVHGCGFVVAAAALMPLSAQARQVPAEVLADRMLAAIGGRSAWARTTNTINDSRQNRVEEPTVVRSVITLDFTRPRFRIESTAPGLHVVRVVDGDAHWRLTRSGTIEDVPPDVLEADRLWYAGHVYRTIHRIATRDPALALTVAADGRLEVSEAGARIAWFALDALGEPYRFGAHGDDVGSVTGPWIHVQDGIHHPSWVARPDGTWRAQINRLAVNVALPDSLFARPRAPGGGASERR